MGGSSKTWIQSASGLKIDLLDPDPANILIGDIAYALAGLNRYTGHARPRYNVAEHSTWVSIRAAELAKAAGKSSEEIVKIARWGLLHDATEAYLGDVSRPLKHLPGMEGYKRLEKVWEAVIAKRFGLEGEMPAEVRQADEEMLGTEAVQIMQPVHPEWGATCPSGKLPDAIPGLKVGMSADAAENAFMMIFSALFGFPGVRQ